MDNAYIYTRVSTAMQIDGFSLDAQEAEIREFAKSRHINIVEKYTDEGKSGKNAEHRPAFNQMMEDIRSKKDNIRYVLVFKLSRFARNTSDTAKYLQELSSYGVGLLGVKDGIDTSTVTGKMIANIMGAVAEVELENIHEQSLAGRIQKAKSGEFNGAQPPFGYATEDKKLVVDEEEAEVVRRIFREYVDEGASINDITRRLNEGGVRRKLRGNTKLETFTLKSVRDILSNPVHIGRTVYGRRHTVKVEGTNNETKVVRQTDKSKIIEVEGIHEPLVSEETFKAAQDRLHENVRHRATRSDSNTVYPLTGLVICPECGKHLFGYSAPARKKKNGKEGMYDRYISYRCISGRDRNGIACSLGNKYYSGTKLEKEVKEVISAMVTMPEFVEVVAKKIDIQTDIGTLKKKKSAIEADIKKYTANVIQTGKRISELDVEDKHYERRLETLNGVLDELYEKLDEAEKRYEEICRDIATIEKSVITKDSIFDMLKAFSEYYDVLEDEDKKKFLQAIVRSIEIYPNRTKKAHWIKRINFSFPVTYDGESGALVVSNNDSTVETVVLMSKEV